MIRASDEFPSFFTPRNMEPFIVDCGANIGVSVLEWKSRWPMAQILCFEPDPDAFQLLELNIERNDIPGIRCIESAIAPLDGTTELFGEIGTGADARGNSIQAEWGIRDDTDSVTVACQRLSPILAKQPVAFLKMDIEGAEEEVLLEAVAQLHRVDALYVEVHETDELDTRNCCARIEKLLLEADFKLEKESRFGEHALPPELHDWRESVNARQTQLLCWRQ
ncbi:MAG: FkbM family methyltransferase [Rubripirellula sp.]